jgi:hypothetical protein
MPWGGKQPGAGRPKGVPNKATAEIKALAQKHTPAAMKELARIMLNSESDAARVAAIKEMFDRGYGRPAQAIVGGDETEEAIKHVVMWKNAGQ